jgi:hypothetical protein
MEPDHSLPAQFLVFRLCRREEIHLEKTSRGGAENAKYTELLFESISYYLKIIYETE